MSDLTDGAALAAGNAGDVLVLTKPLGLGIAAAAKAAGAGGPALHEAAEAAGAPSNDEAAAVAASAGVTAGAAVGGAGLLGALHELVTASGVGAAVRIDRVPVLDGALQMVSAGHVSADAAGNREAVAEHVDYDDKVTDEARALLVDPQDGGGLLLAIPAAQLRDVLAALGASGVRGLPIGQLLPQPVGRIGVVTPITRLGVSGGGSRTAKPAEEPPPQPT